MGGLLKILTIICGDEYRFSHSEPEFVAHGTTLLQEPRKPRQQEREGKV